MKKSAFCLECVFALLCLTAAPYYPPNRFVGAACLFCRGKVLVYEAWFTKFVESARYRFVRVGWVTGRAWKRVPPACQSDLGWDNYPFNAGSGLIKLDDRVYCPTCRADERVDKDLLT